MISTLTTVRYAWRVIVSTPVASAIAVLALALAVAGALSVYSVIDAFVLRRVAVDEPDRLVEISMVNRDGRDSGISVPIYRELAARQDVFDHTVGWFEDLIVNVDAGGQLRLANVWPVTDGYFAVLDQQPALGRLFDPSGAALNADALLDSVVIADRFWAERFGRNPDVLGQQIRIEGQAFTVVGVTTQGFSGLRRY